jgi:hypothetical protein
MSTKRNQKPEAQEPPHDNGAEQQREENDQPLATDSVPLVERPTIPANAFDLTSVRLDDDLDLMHAETVIDCDVRKNPKPDWWFRVHPDPAYRVLWYLIELNDGRDFYWVHRPLWPHLLQEPLFKPRLLVLAQTAQGELFLWPLRKKVQGEADKWLDKQLEAVRYAREKWTRLYYLKGTTGYKVEVANGPLPDPVWPDLTLEQLIETAFRDRLIVSLDDPVLKKLRGEALA